MNLDRLRLLVLRMLLSDLVVVDTRMLLEQPLGRVSLKRYLKIVTSR